MNIFCELSSSFSLGVIGALVKTDEQEVINFLLTTEIIPLCLRIMETGSELSKTVATFILQKILLDDTGLYYICQTYDRFSHVAMILVSISHVHLSQQRFFSLFINGLGQNGDCFGERIFRTSSEACRSLLFETIRQPEVSFLWMKSRHLKIMPTRESYVQGLRGALPVPS